MRWLNILLEFNKVVPEVSVAGGYECKACSDYFLAKFIDASSDPLAKMKVVDRQMREAPVIELAAGVQYPKCPRCGRRTKWTLKS